MQQVRGIRRLGGGGSWMFRVWMSVLRRMLLRRLIRDWTVCDVNVDLLRVTC